jgi:hypothetical protein
VIGIARYAAVFVFLGKPKARGTQTCISSSPARRLASQQGVIDFPNTARVFIN